MNSSLTPTIAPNPYLARLLAALSIVLLVVFLVAVLTTALLPEHLDPQWQPQFANTVISYAPLPLVGALLLPLAWLRSGQPSHEAPLARLKPLAPARCPRLPPADPLAWLCQLEAPYATKDDASPIRLFQPPWDLMESINVSLQRGCQG